MYAERKAEWPSFAGDCITITGRILGKKIKFAVLCAIFIENNRAPGAALQMVAGCAAVVTISSGDRAL
jgi:hypothetical protein